MRPQITHVAPTHRDRHFQTMQKGRQMQNGPYNARHSRDKRQARRGRHGRHKAQGRQHKRCERDVQDKSASLF